MVPDVPSGQQPAAVQPSTLPAYFAAGTPQNAAVPATADVAIPAVLTLGVRARPNVYLAFGDSITWGDGSTDLSGYRGYLRDRLHAYWRKGAVEASGIPGTKSEAGSERAPGVLADYRPAYLLILYGTNDWNDPQCRDWFPCFTIDSLRAIVNHTRGAGAKPILATLPPVNPDYEDRNASARNAWVRQANDAIHALAQEEQVPVAEVHAEFSSQPSLPPLFNDFLHPNNDGYHLIANAFFEAITRPYPAASTSGMPILFALSARRP
jgi:lysophospholipase L1-like esterase